MIDYYDLFRIFGERNFFYVRVRVIEDLIEGILVDIIRIYYEDGISCNIFVFVELGDSVLFNFELYDYFEEFD